MRNKYLPILIAAFCAAVCPAVALAEGQGSELFDGAGRYQALEADAPRAALPPEELKRELRAHIDFRTRGTEKEQAGYERLLDRLMASPTARREAEEFVRQDQRITLSFEPMGNSMLATENGRTAVYGQRGSTFMNRVPPEVELNELFLDHDMDKAAETFAHEVFGHAVSAGTLRGEDRDVNGYAMSEEENAMVIGWLVGAELGSTPDQAAWEYAANPREAMGDMAMTNSIYALRLTSREMLDPLPVYRARVAKAEKLKLGVQEKEKMIATWITVVRHFVLDHGMDKAAFRDIANLLDNSRRALPDQRMNLHFVISALNGRIAYYSSEKGKAALELMKKNASAGFLRERDAEILAYRKKLEGLLAGKTLQASLPPPAAGQITFDQLKQMLKKDKESACKLGEAK